MFEGRVVFNSNDKFLYSTPQIPYPCNFIKILIMPTTNNEQRITKYDVYAIGNAIVDIVTEVEHDFFKKNEVEKGVMTLVDEKRQQHLMQAIDMQKSQLKGGGSDGNTVAAINQIGGKSFY
jgi:hypothetical protein